MSQLSMQEVENAAMVYEEFYVPALFQPWAERVLDEVRIGLNDRVLDVACGTGVISRAAAARLGAHGSVVGLDMNPCMLSVAKQIQPEIEWRRGSAEALPFENESFDAVISQFGLMFFNDQRTALQEMGRVLAPGGCLAAAVFDRIDNIPAYATMASLLEQLGHKSAAEALRSPCVLGDTDALSSLFADAGFPTAVVTTDEITTRFPDVRTMVWADVKGWFPLAQIFLTPHQHETLIAEAEQALKPFITANGNVVFQTSAHIVTVTK